MMRERGEGDQGIGGRRGNHGVREKGGRASLFAAAAVPHRAGARVAGFYGMK